MRMEVGLVVAVVVTVDVGLEVGLVDVVGVVVSSGGGSSLSGCYC